jgi:hypothetical protein
MTEKQHVKILFTTFCRWFPDVPKEDAQRYCESAVSRFMVAMDLELEDREQGVVVEMDTIRNVQPKPEPPRITQPVQHQPPPPTNTSIIVAPDSQEAKETIADAANRFRSKTPLRIPVGGRPGSPRSSSKPWKQPQLREYVEQNTPPILSVAVEGRDKPVNLIRNIEVQLGTDTIKLSYGLPDMQQPGISLPNSPDQGETLNPMTVDTQISTILSCDEHYDGLEPELMKLADIARSAMKPKPDHLASATPRRVGPLTYRIADPKKEHDPTADPHDEVGPLTNHLTGKVW